MKNLAPSLIAIALAIPAIILAASGVIHLRNGQALEAAFPVPLALSLNIPMPKRAYEDAARSLSAANTRDGDAEIGLAEARFQAGDKPQNLLSQVETGLLHAPASAEGWEFYSKILEQSDPNKAALAIAYAFTLAPYDFFQAGSRAQLAARLWDHLDSDARNAALKQARMLWDEPQLRDQMMQLLATPDGSNLITRAYAGEPGTIRAINRFASARRRQLQTKNS